MGHSSSRRGGGGERGGEAKDSHGVIEQGKRGGRWRGRGWGSNPIQGWGGGLVGGMAAAEENNLLSTDR